MQFRTWLLVTSLVTAASACSPTPRPVETTPDPALSGILAAMARAAGTEDMSSIEFSRHSGGTTSALAIFQSSSRVVEVTYTGGEVKTSELPADSSRRPWSFTIPASAFDVDALADKVPWSCASPPSGHKARAVVVPREHVITSVACGTDPVWVLLDGERVTPETGPSPERAHEKALADAALFFDEPTVGGIGAKATPSGISTTVRAAKPQGRDRDGQPCWLKVERGGPSEPLALSCTSQPTGPTLATAELPTTGVVAMWGALGSPSQWEYQLASAGTARWVTTVGSSQRGFTLQGSPA